MSPHVPNLAKVWSLYNVPPMSAALSRSQGECRKLRAPHSPHGKLNWRGAAAREGPMAESVYNVIELVGTSTESWEKAAAAAI